MTPPDVIISDESLPGIKPSPDLYIVFSSLAFGVSCAAFPSVEDVRIRLHITAAPTLRDSETIASSICSIRDIENFINMKPKTTTINMVARNNLAVSPHEDGLMLYGREDKVVAPVANNGPLCRP